MKKLLFALLGTTMMLGSATTLMAEPCRACNKQDKTKEFNNLKKEIPVVRYQSENWERVPDVAQNADADWSNAIGRAHRVTLKEAIEIAESNPEITYFFIVKNRRLILGNKPNVRAFHRGEVVFFKGEPTWGEAKRLADGYVKKAAAPAPAIAPAAK